MNDINILNKLLENEPAYRMKQVYKLIFNNLIEDWNFATTLPNNLRKILIDNFSLNINHEIIRSKDSFKAVITLDDGLKIETVLMKHKDKRNTVCVSSQVGCPIKCNFCATGKLSFKRNLSAFEILEQILLWARFLKQTNEKVTNIVFMGMGEPFLNYDNVLNSIRIINDKNCFNIGARNISISTVGITEGIKKLSKEKLNVNLAVSLHAPEDNIRQKIIPLNNKYNINKILRSINDYMKIKKRRIMIEYLMIKDFNDSKECAKKLASLLNKHLYFVNLITYNPTGSFKPSPSWKVKLFKDTLEKDGVTVTQRYKFGDDINAACGQLIYKYF